MALGNITDFKTRLLVGGARANYYVVYGPTIGEDMQFLARATSLPASNVNAVEVMTPGGRKIKLAGERTFEDWTVSVYNDTQMTTRRKFEMWQSACAQYGTPVGADALAAYETSEWTVTQFSRSGAPMRTYRFFNMWPSGLGSIELSFDEQSSIEQFDVTFSYSHFEPVDAGSTIDPDLISIAANVAGSLSVSPIGTPTPSSQGTISEQLPAAVDSSGGS